MRFATVDHHGAARCGVVAADAWHPLPAAVSLLDLLRQGPDALAEAGEAALRTGSAVQLRELRLLPPLEPPTVRDFVAFEEHVAGVRRGIGGSAGVPAEWYEAPTFYFANPYAVVGAHDEVAVPPGCHDLDFELEVAAVIGREGRDLTPEQGREHIAGYTILNDWSARDLQAREMKIGLGPAKGKDFATTLGPWLVTVDELEPYRDADGFLRLGLRAEVNGREVARDLLSHMGWRFEDLVAYASRGAVVRPGDVLGSGTCGNGGCLAELWGRNGRQDPPPLRPGDVVAITVEGIGTIRNPVVAGAEPAPIPPARRRPPRPPGGRTPPAARCHRVRTERRLTSVFEYFPGNYVWNLAVVGALNSGGYIDEVDRACRPLRDAAQRGEDAGTEEFFAAWSVVAERLVELAEQDRAGGCAHSAAQKYARAAMYLSTAERMQSRHWQPRRRVYGRILELFAGGVAGENCIRVEIPFQDASLPAYLVSAGDAAPCVIQWNGLDSTKEMMHQSGFARELAVRGVSTLMVDTPGSGEALRLRGLTAIPETERWAAACVDYLEQRSDVDSERIGIVGWSLGGYYAPRAAAFEKRLALCVAWGANHNWGELQKRRLEREGERPVPHYWEHVQWVWGAATLDEFLAIAQRVTLAGVVDKITVPFLVTHGEKDRQIPLDDAWQSYREATSSPRRELKVFTAADGGVEHISLDNFRLAGTYIADWIAETFGTQQR